MIDFMMFMIICYDYDTRIRNCPLNTSNGWVSTKSCRYYYLRFSSILDIVWLSSSLDMVIGLDIDMVVFFDGYGSWISRSCRIMDFFVVFCDCFQIFM